MDHIVGSEIFKLCGISELIDSLPILMVTISVDDYITTKTSLLVSKTSLVNSKKSLINSKTSLVNSKISHVNSKTSLVSITTSLAKMATLLCWAMGAYWKWIGEWMKRVQFSLKVE